MRRRRDLLISLLAGLPAAALQAAPEPFEGDPFKSFQ